MIYRASQNRVYSGRHVRGGMCVRFSSRLKCSQVFLLERKSMALSTFITHDVIRPIDIEKEIPDKFLLKCNRRNFCSNKCEKEQIGASVLAVP